MGYWIENAFLGQYSFTFFCYAFVDVCSFTPLWDNVHFFFLEAQNKKKGAE